MSAIRSLLAVAACAIVPACGGGDDGGGVVVVDDPVGDTVAEGQARGEVLADDVFGELAGDDYVTVIGKSASILAAVNDGEINQAAFAVQVVVADDIFAFANDLIIDHEDANVELDAVVRTYGIGFIPSTAESAVLGQASAGLAQLRATPPADIDFAFTELQVIMHAQALVVLDELYVHVGAGEMGDYILDQQFLVDFHLSEAEALLATFY